MSNLGVSETGDVIHNMDYHESLDGEHVSKIHEFIIQSSIIPSSTPWWRVSLDRLKSRGDLRVAEDRMQVVATCW